MPFSLSRLPKSSLANAPAPLASSFPPILDSMQGIINRHPTEHRTDRQRWPSLWLRHTDLNA
jgi:hypothetical protein